MTDVQWKEMNLLVARMPDGTEYVKDMAGRHLSIEDADERDYRFFLQAAGRQPAYGRKEDIRHLWMSHIVGAQLS